MNVSPVRIEMAMSHAQQFAARLRAEDPELDHDDLLLALDSETEAPDLIRRVIRSAIEDEAFEEAIAARIRDLQARKSRYAARKEAARGLARDMMTAIETHKIVDTEFSATIGSPRSKAVVVNAELLPEALVRVKVERSPDMALIDKAIKAGGIPPGVEIQPAPPIFTVRVK
jgi:hypothetical protein